MGKHHSPAPTAQEPQLTRTHVRNVALAMVTFTILVLAMIASNAGAFAKPTLHHLSVAVAAPAQITDALRGQQSLDITAVADAAAARDQVSQRTADAAFVVDSPGSLNIYVAGGGGRSVAAAAETVGRAVAAKPVWHRQSPISPRRRRATRRARSSSTPSSSSRSARRSGLRRSAGWSARCAGPPPWRCAPSPCPRTPRCWPAW